MTNIKKFLNEVMAELKKVSWPSKKQIMSSTNVVIIVSLIAGVYIFVADIFFSKLIEFVIK
ncbi:MAG: preprotein translocase subunit SecE [Candidatus Muiribacterium halophilum]|uniref:Protein translocase subunit SecE n=1 Tax=Muiribacterium halophilum TaxID=2053465 RepID=A0A2N5ZGQ0_MUIH1|nr:MAG: preprotein translocase subunit SecE [Candidatus Muirbacterium halophilum]